MITIAFNEEDDEIEQGQAQEQEQNDDNINSASDNIVSQDGKEKIDNAKEKTKELLKNEKVKAFIMAHLTTILIVVGIILLILIIIGLFSFFTNIVGMMLGKIKQFGIGIWANFSGFFTGDKVTAAVTKEQVIDLAQYIQNMGYDIEGCGFGKVEYEDSGADVENQTKQIKKIINPVDDKEYLKAYIASNEATYVLATYSLKGFLKEAESEVVAFIKNDPNELVNNKEVSTGMINILDTSMLTSDKRFVKVDRNAEKMTVYTNTLYLPIIGAVSKLFGLDYTNNYVQWGSTFSYDMSTWTAKYGKPVELFLSVHLSTMMPDLAWRIAKDAELNTKVNIVLQDINVTYETKITTKDGKTYNTKDIVNAFLDYGLTGENKSYTYKEMVPVSGTNANVTVSNSTNSTTEQEYEEVEVSGEVNFYKLILENLGTQEEKNEFFAALIKHIENNFLPESLGINIGNALLQSDNDDSHLTKFFKMLGRRINNLASLAFRALTWDSPYIVYLKTGTEEVPGLPGITYDDLFELADIVGQGLGDGIDGVKWPYIQSVTNHWYYKDIDFSVGVYRKAKSATKKIAYRSVDENSLLNKHGIQVNLDAVLKADEGIVYQVCEPEAEGPNEHILEIFKDKYYKYDGTVETAKKIENARLYDMNGGPGIVGDANIEEISEGIEKQEVSFEENKSNALAAFTILENMHTEEGDFVYRSLKDLVVHLRYFTKDELTSDLKNAMLWIINTDNINEEFKVEKDANEYGMLIKNVIGREVLAPENCEISEEDGVLTLKFTQMSDSTEELLKYIYEDDYKYINKDILVGLTMKIKGINPNKTSGSAQRGDIIGTVSDTNGLQVIMFDIDKSLVENIEEFMVQEHNKAYEEAMKQKRERKYKQGIDIGRVAGDGFVREYSNGSSAIYYGDGKWTYSDSDFDLLCAITAAEDQGSYEGALAVITTACNRTQSNKWKSRGSDPLSQYMSNGQFAGFYDGNYKKWLNGKYPSYVREAVQNALNGARNHRYGSFRANYATGREQIGSGGNWYFDVII